ncbi:hypothetical protein SDC9_142959 [bioreactor metagenome]|uniref:Uncharacterized protein n=1 Tax=bioreactor metagenome TaxID=1076179 RepID=A0A645E1Z2_9ZZZZ
MQILLVSTIGVGISAAHRKVAAAKVIGNGSTKTVAVLFFHIAVLVFTLILQGQIQAIHDAEEVGVTVSCQAAGTFGHKVIGLCGGVAAEFREHIGPCFHVIQRTQVTTIIKRAKIF